jgi:hypothetical protein
MRWMAIVTAGFIATTLAAAFFGVVRSLGWTRLSPSILLGCLLYENPDSPIADTVGFLLLLLLGSTLVPMLYGLVFAAWIGPSWWTGMTLGAVHGLATTAMLPVVGTISACVRRGALPPPRRFGVGWGRFTPAGLVAGHLIYGAVVGATLAGF